MKEIGCKNDIPLCGYPVFFHVIFPYLSNRRHIKPTPRLDARKALVVLKIIN